MVASSTTAGTPARRKPGRPRSQRSRGAILRATYELIEKDGLDALTVEAVARRARVGKPTIYRYWANAQELALAALVARNALEQPPRIEGEAFVGLEALVEAMQTRLCAPAGRLMLRMLAGMDPDSHHFDQFREQVIARYQRIGRQKLQEAKDAGMLRADIEPVQAVDLMIGTVLGRLILSPHTNECTHLASEIVEQFRRGWLPREGEN